jgi:hypothetical protein
MAEFGPPSLPGMPGLPRKPRMSLGPRTPRLNVMPRAPRMATMPKENIMRPKGLRTDSHILKPMRPSFSDTPRDY